MLTRKRNKQGKFTTKEEEDEKPEIFSFVLPSWKTLLRYVFTFIILAPWIFIMLFRFNFKDKLLELFEIMLGEINSNRTCYLTKENKNWG